MLTRATLLSLTLTLTATSCTGIEVPEPPSAPSGGKADDALETTLTCSYMNRNIAALTPRSAPVAAADLTGLRAIPGVALPSIGHAADGYFHPQRRVIHSGRLDAGIESIGDYLDALGFDSSTFRGGAAVGVPTPYLEGGTFSTVAPAPHDPTQTVRVGVWNLARGKELPVLIENLARMDADIWILNEGDHYGQSAGGIVVAREIARALGWYYVSVGEFYELRDDRRGLSGNAILSRYPLHDVQSVYLPIYGGRDWALKNVIDPQLRCGQRSAVSARVTITLADGSTEIINVISAHLENASQPGDRKEQLRVVRELLAVPGEPTVLGGDFNTLGVGEGKTIRDALARGDHAPFTFADTSKGDNTNTFLLSRIDWLLAQGLETSGYRVAREATGSDHKPVLSEITIR